MKKGTSACHKFSGVRQDLLRGDNIFALIIFIVVVVLLVNMVVSIWNNALFQREVKQETALRNVRVITLILARACETLLATNELSLVRRTVVDMAREQSLDVCRLELPDGSVLADADPSRITMIDLPPLWADRGWSPIKEEEHVNEQSISLQVPLDIPNKGSVHLKVAASMERHQGIVMERQTGQLAIACLALVTMLLVHRHARFRLKAIGAIHDALLAAREDDWDLSSLQLDPRLGREAMAWNRLLGQHQGQQIRSTMEQIEKTVHQGSESQDAFAATCDALPYGIILVDEEGRAIYANGVAGILWQTSISDIKATDIRHHVADERVQEAIHAALTRPEARHHVIEVKAKESTEEGILRYTVCAVRQEDRNLVALCIEDMTQYAVAKKARDGFLAQAAHELRTPLTNVRLYVERALEECEHDVAQAAASLNIINEESQRLSRVVSEILSVSEMEVGSFGIKKDDVRLDTLFEQLQSDYTAQAKDRKIALVFELPPKLPVLHGDRDKLLLAFHNVLGNALKYTLKGGHVTVAVTLEEDRICTIIKDTGVGIRAEELEKIFEKFYRADDKRIHAITGSGLGLPIAREVIRLHGGDLTVTSEWDKGSAFTLTLPLSEEVDQGEYSGTTGRSHKRG